MDAVADKNLKLCTCNKCGPQGRLVNRSTHRDHMFAFDEGYSSGPDEGLGEPGYNEAPDGMEGAYQGLTDTLGEELDDGLLPRPTAGLVPTEEDLLTGAFELDADSDESDLDPQSASTDDFGSQPEWLQLSELLLAWLNVDHSVSDRTCELLLMYMQTVAYTNSAGTSGSGKRKGLSARMARVRKTLGLRGLGITYALCPDRSCWTPHLLKVAIDERVLTCRNCGKDLFDIPPHSVHGLGQGPSPLMLRQVKVRFRYEPITTWIQQLLPRPNVLAYCQEHTQRQKTAGVYRDLYDGSNWSSRDGDESFDLVLRLSLMIDWVQPFYRLGTASYSCCVVSLRVDDLPFRLRNTSSYTHVCCILPGPQKPTAEGLHAALDIMVAELCRLHEEGLHVPELLNHDTGLPLKVRIRLERLLADTDARTITAGFPSHSSRGQFCPWCTIDYNNWVSAMLEGEDAPPRDAERHRIKSLSALPDAVPKLRPAEVESLRREEAACLSVLYKIPGWSSLHNAPVDVMHNLDLGLCKHFWVQTLVDGKLLDQAGLQVSKEVLQTTTYPIGVTRISPDLGHTSGGTPTAAGWSVLSQYIMPVLIASAWTGPLSTSAHKTFHTAKVRMVKQGLADGMATEPTPASTSVASTSATASRTASTSNPGSTEATPDPKRPRKRKQKGKEKEKEPEFTKSVSLVSMLEAALVLALACRLAHSRVIDEPQLQVLHNSLKTFVTINATEIGPLWVPYNFHIALHIADQVRRHGPAWTYWSYPQERSYGLMKRIKTNRRRGGELEHTMQTRSEDKHRIMALLESTPITPLSRLLRERILTESDANLLGQGSQHPQRSPEENDEERSRWQDGVADDAADSDTEDRPDRQSISVNLNNTDLQQICVLANRNRGAGQASFVPCYNYNSLDSELIVDSAAISTPHLKTAEFVIRKRTKQHGARSDPSACIISTSRGQRLAYFQAVIKVRYNDRRSQERTKQSVVVHVLDPLPWPQGPGLSSPTWNRLKYVAACPTSLTRAIVDVEDVLGPAIVFPGGRILGRPNSVIGTLVNSIRSS